MSDNTDFFTNYFKASMSFIDKAYLILKAIWPLPLRLQYCEPILYMTFKERF